MDITLHEQVQLFPIEKQRAVWSSVLGALEGRTQHSQVPQHIRKCCDALSTEDDWQSVLKCAGKQNTVMVNVCI